MRSKNTRQQATTRHEWKCAAWHTSRAGRTDGGRRSLSTQTGRQTRERAPHTAREEHTTTHSQTCHEAPPHGHSTRGTDRRCGCTDRACRSSTSHHPVHARVQSERRPCARAPVFDLARIPPEERRRRSEAARAVAQTHTHMHTRTPQGTRSASCPTGHVTRQAKPASCGRIYSVPRIPCQSPAGGPRNGPLGRIIGRARWLRRAA